MIRHQTQLVACNIMYHSTAFWHCHWQCQCQALLPVWSCRCNIAKQVITYTRTLGKQPGHLPSGYRSLINLEEDVMQECADEGKPLVLLHAAIRCYVG